MHIDMTNGSGCCAPPAISPFSFWLYNAEEFSEAQRTQKRPIFIFIHLFIFHYDTIDENNVFPIIIFQRE